MRRGQPADYWPIRLMTAFSCWFSTFCSDFVKWPLFRLAIALFSAQICRSLLRTDAACAWVSSHSFTSW